MLDSKLPEVGTTIFTVMSALAQKEGALNLSQGFPDFDGPEALLERVHYHLTHGKNQYPPMAGVLELREAIAQKVLDLYTAKVDHEHEITVTAGATEALFCAIAACVRAQDEVILFDPAYDSYAPVIKLQGARAVHIPLLAEQNFAVDWQRVQDAITPRTRAIIMNSPHNPTGSVWSSEDLVQLQRLVLDHGLFVIADEVYEHMVFDGAPHHSVCAYPELFQRSFVISSFGKTYHVTGWKVGYCVAPRPLTEEFRKIHQFVNFTVNTPVQYGLADFLSSQPQHHLELPHFYQRKRDVFCSALEQSRFSLVPSAGTYFQLLDCSAITTQPDVELAPLWTRDIKIASIPVSVFYADLDAAPKNYLRFCFAKEDDTLRHAAEILSTL